MQDADHVGEVVLALLVLGRDAGPARARSARRRSSTTLVPISRISRCAAVASRCSTMRHRPALLPHHAAVAGGIRDLGGQQRGRRAGRTWCSTSRSSVASDSSGTSPGQHQDACRRRRRRRTRACSTAWPVPRRSFCSTKPAPASRRDRRPRPRRPRAPPPRRPGRRAPGRHRPDRRSGGGRRGGGGPWAGPERMRLASPAARMTVVS